MVDPLHFLERDTLLRFFRVHKTELSLMENPHTFIRQLKDHDLIPEDRYEKMTRMKSKDRLRRGLYEALDWLERKRAHHIKKFWRCVFKDAIMQHYPALVLLRYRLTDGSYVTDIESPEKEESGRQKRQNLSEDEDEDERKDRSVKKKRNLRKKSVCDDDDEEEEQPGTSSRSTQSQGKKSKKIHFSSPLKAGEKSDIWNWAFFKTQLPVTCGKTEGLLMRDKLARGEKCISVGKQWFTPSEFEKFAGRQSSRNWKLSIRCKGTPLGKLIQEGHLKTTPYRSGFPKAKKMLFPADDDDTTDEEDEEEEEQADTSQKTVFKVTCGALTGTLHKKRFASGNCGKSIRTQTSWMTPVEFAKEASDERDPSWRKHIKCEGKPLSVLIQAKVLVIHSPLCDCELCCPDSEDLQEGEKNDDECCVCKSDEKDEEELVMCDRCPLSFHLTCHLPHVQEAVLGDGNHWMCTFCEFTSNQEYYQDELELDAAMSSQISQHMLQCQYLILRLCSADEDQTIARDPNLSQSGYSSVIDTPMWLGKVAEKLERQLYKTVGEFVSDVRLIFTNFASYNQEDADSLAVGNRLQTLFDKEFNNVFNIHEQIVGQ